jgi:glycosyltransferase involved in cell wall biosynthesis
MRVLRQIRIPADDGADRRDRFSAVTIPDAAVAHRLRSQPRDPGVARASPRHRPAAATAIKVLCVTPYGTRGRGGIDRLYQHLRRSHEREAPAGVGISYFVSRGSAPGVLWVLAFPWRAALFAARMIALRPDIVHLNFSIGGSVYRKYVLLRIAEAFGARTLLHFHGTFTAADVASASLKTRCFRDMCHRATRLIALGDRYRTAFTDILGVPADKLEVLANAVPDFFGERALPKPAGPAVSLLFIGDLGAHKGLDVLVDALALLGRRTRAWGCVIAGNGNPKVYRERIAAAGCGDLVQFPGWLDARAVERCLTDCDIVILPSRAENLPLSLVEGACAGAALVATPVGEVAEVLQDDRNGIVVALTAVALADALERLIARREELAAMQVQSRAIYGEKFNINGFTERLTGIYRRLMTAQP